MVSLGMAAPSGFLYFHHESFEFRCVGVGINYAGTQDVGPPPFRLAFILFNAAIAPMDGNADGIDLLATHLKRLDAFGDHGLGNVVTTGLVDLPFAPAFTTMARPWSPSLSQN